MFRDSNETELGISNQEAFPSVGKNVGVFLETCCTKKCVPTAISGGVAILEVRGYHLLYQINSQ